MRKSRKLEAKKQAKAFLEILDELYTRLTTLL